MSDTVLETLRNVEFFHDIPDEYLSKVAKFAEPVEFPAHTEILREYETAKKMYVIIHGRVSLVICQPKVGCRQLQEVSDGELIGWSPLVGRARLSDTAYTLTATSTLAIDAEQILTLCDQDPRFGYEFMRRTAYVMADRLSATRLQLSELSGFHLPDVPIESD